MRPFTIDRRCMYGLGFLVVMVPLLIPIGLPLAVTPEVKDAYDALQRLPAGSPVLVMFDYQVAVTELTPVATAVLNILNSRGAKVVTVCTFSDNVSMPETITASTYGKAGKVYGTDYVNLGFYAGGEPSLVALCEKIRNVYKNDFRGTPIDSLPLMQKITGLDDFSLVIDLNSSAGAGVTAEMVIRQINVIRKKPLLAGVTGMMGAMIRPYLDAKSIQGLMVGLKSGAELEKLSGVPGDALAAMDALTLADVMIITLLVIGNAAFLHEKRSRRAKAQPEGGAAR